MSAKDDMQWKDQVDIVLRGPDGRVKQVRTSNRLNPIIVIIALILLIPISIYKILFGEKNR